MTQVVNLKWRRGDDFKRRLRMVTIDANGDPNGFPDMTGCILRSHVRNSSYDTDYLFALTCTVVEPQVGDDLGMVEIEVPAETTAALEFDGYFTAYWDLEVTDTGGQRSTPVEGQITLKSDYTYGD